jgi:hypothetical protein
MFGIPFKLHFTHNGRVLATGRSLPSPEKAHFGVGNLGRDWHRLLISIRSNPRCFLLECPSAGGLWWHVANEVLQPKLGQFCVPHAGLSTPLSSLLSAFILCPIIHSSPHRTHEPAPPFHKVIPIPYLLSGWPVSSGKGMVALWLALAEANKPHHLAWWPGIPHRQPRWQSFVKARSQKSTECWVSICSVPHCQSSYRRLQGTFCWPLAWEILSMQALPAAHVSSVLWSSPSVLLSAFWFSYAFLLNMYNFSYSLLKF